MDFDLKHDTDLRLGQGLSNCSCPYLSPLDSKDDTDKVSDISFSTPSSTVRSGFMNSTSLAVAGDEDLKLPTDRLSGKKSMKQSVQKTSEADDLKDIKVKLVSLMNNNHIYPFFDVEVTKSILKSANVFVDDRTVFITVTGVQNYADLVKSCDKKLRDSYFYGLLEAFKQGKHIIFNREHVSFDCEDDLSKLSFTQDVRAFSRNVSKIVSHLNKNLKYSMFLLFSRIVDRDSDNWYYYNVTTHCSHNSFESSVRGYIKVTSSLKYADSFGQLLRIVVVNTTLREGVYLGGLSFDRLTPYTREKLLRSNLKASIGDYRFEERNSRDVRSDSGRVGLNKVVSNLTDERDVAGTKDIVSLGTQTDKILLVETSLHPSIPNTFLGRIVNTVMLLDLEAICYYAGSVFQGCISSDFEYMRGWFDQCNEISFLRAIRNFSSNPTLVGNVSSLNEESIDQYVFMTNVKCILEHFKEWYLNDESNLAVITIYGTHVNPLLTEFLSPRMAATFPKCIELLTKCIECDNISENFGEITKIDISRVPVFYYDLIQTRKTSVEPIENIVYSYLVKEHMEVKIDRISNIFKNLGNFF